MKISILLTIVFAFHVVESAEYKITVSIVDCKYCGTEAKQYVTIKGLYGQTEEHLCDADFNLFGHDVTCTIKDNLNIGPYRCLTWRNGGKDGWDITQLIVRVDNSVKHTVVPQAPYSKLEITDDQALTFCNEDAKTWRNDLRCGKEFPLKNGKPSECNPTQKNGYVCCNHGSGWCGKTVDHCYCQDCIDYSEQKWRSDKRCGPHFPLSDGSEAHCNPHDPNGYTCCKKNSGHCGRTLYHCKCNDCENYACPNCYEEEVNSDKWDALAIHYDVWNGKIKPLRPSAVGSEDIVNRGKSKQSVAMHISETVSESMSFSHSAGVSVSVGASFKAGIPFIGESEVSVEVSQSYEFSYGTESSVEKSLSADFTCVGSAKKKTKCKALLIKDQVTVPYTMKWGLKRAPACRCEENGQFHEVSATRLELQVEEFDLNTERLVKRWTSGLSANTTGGIGNRV